MKFIDNMSQKGTDKIYVVRGDNCSVVMTLRMHAHLSLFAPDKQDFYNKPKIILVACVCFFFLWVTVDDLCLVQPGGPCDGGVLRGG